MQKLKPEAIVVILTMLLSFFFILDFSIAESAYESETESLILDSAEKFFLLLKKSDFKNAWELLTEKSRKAVIDDVYNVSKKLGQEIKKEAVAKDFNSNGVIFNSYWNAYIQNFNPDMVLEQSKWEIGRIGKDEAEIIINYKKSEKPAIVKMLKENGAWKIGLVETFWPRR